MQALATVRHVTIRLDDQPERRGVSGGCPDARRVLKALKLTDLKPPDPPEGQETVMERQATRSSISPAESASRSRA